MVLPYFENSFLMTIFQIVLYGYIIYDAHLYYE